MTMLLSRWGFLAIANCLLSVCVVGATRQPAGVAVFCMQNCWLCLMIYHFLLQICRRFISVGDRYDGTNFFTVQDGVRVATPLLLVLAIIELSDVVFAVDSIPAIFGVTLDPFIVYTSNM